MIAFWSAAIVIFLVIEGVTAGLASIWFAIGSAAALISALFGAPVWLQIVWFVIISGVTLFFTRPLAKKYVNSRTVPTNADRLIGMEGIVTERIDNLKGAGLVAIDGKTWTARSARDEIIEKGAKVNALEISGVKLIVAEAREHAEA
jgi:membrane protein implicated in regulation of membrane protease activity